MKKKVAENNEEEPRRREEKRHAFDEMMRQDDRAIRQRLPREKPQMLFYFYFFHTLIAAVWCSEITDLPMLGTCLAFNLNQFHSFNQFGKKFLLLFYTRIYLNVTLKKTL